MRQVTLKQVCLDLTCTG